MKKVGLIDRNPYRESRRFICPPFLNRRVMKRTLIVLAALFVLFAGIAPMAVAAHEDDHGDEPTESSCEGDDRGPDGDGGPPGFVADVTPNFLQDLLGSLPVPGFLKSLFGAC